MLTRAGKQAVQTFVNWTTQDNSRNSIPMFPSASIRNTGNEERWVSAVTGNLLSSTNVVSNNWAGFQIGSGSTAPAETDYKLNTQITSGFSGSLSYTERGIDNGSLYMEFGLLITNTGSSNLTVAEVGIVTNNIKCCNSSSATSASNQDVMIERTLLSSPVTIAPTETTLIKYRVTSSMSFS